MLKWGTSRGLRDEKNPEFRLGSNQRQVPGGTLRELLAPRTRGLGLGTLSRRTQAAELCFPAPPPTSLLSPSQVTVSPALATMVGHAWRRRRGSDAYVCLAMGGTCATLVSVLEGLVWVGVDRKPGPCWVQRKEGRALVLALPLMNPILGKPHNLSELYPQFPHLLSGTKNAFLRGSV